MLRYLKGQRFQINPTSLAILQRALFLVATASGLRASQLHGLVRHPSWLVFTPDGRCAILAPSLKLLAKNESQGHNLLPLILSAWVCEGSHYALCPVEAVRRYLAVTEDRTPKHLFVWPNTLKPLSCLQVSRVLCGVIEAADPDKAPKGHDLRAMSVTLAYLCHYSLDRIQQEWAVGF